MTRIKWNFEVRKNNVKIKTKLCFRNSLLIDKAMS